MKNWCFGTNGFVCAWSTVLYWTCSSKGPQNPWKLHLNFLCRWSLCSVTNVRRYVNNYPHCSCTCVSVGSPCPVAQMAYEWFHFHYFCAGLAAPLSVLTKEEQRSVIRFLWSEGVSGAAIHQRLSAQYRNSVLPQRSVYEWIEKLKNGRINVTHDKGARRPSTASTENTVGRGRNIVLLDRWVTIDEVTHVLQISHGSTYEMMHNKLGFHKVCAIWVQNNSQKCINKRAWTSSKKFGSLCSRMRHLHRQNHHWWRNMGLSLRAGE